MRKPVKKTDTIIDGDFVTASVGRLVVDVDALDSRTQDTQADIEEIKNEVNRLHIRLDDTIRAINRIVRKLKK
jgi:hypothetical protein